MRFLLPQGGVSALDAPGQAFRWPEADRALFDDIERHTTCTAQRQLLRVAAHINEPAFIAQVVQAVRGVC